MPFRYVELVILDLLIFGWHEGGNEVLRVLRVFQPLDRGTHGREALTSLDDPSHVR